LGGASALLQSQVIQEYEYEEDEDDDTIQKDENGGIRFRGENIEDEV